MSAPNEMQFPRMTQFEGRHGWLMCSGLSMTVQQREAGSHVQVIPITSKGKLATSSTLQIPVESVPALIAKLTELLIQ